MNARLLALGGAVALLSACAEPAARLPGGGELGGEHLRAATAIARTGIDAFRGGPAGTLAIDPAVLKASLQGVEEPVKLARMDRSGAESTLVLRARNAAVRTWMTPDNIALNLQDGLLISTRGLTGGLAQADVAGSIAAVAAARPGGGPVKTTRVHDRIDTVNRLVRTRYACTLAPAERFETIQILDRAHLTLRITENCVADEHGKGFINLYWRDSHATTVRQSRQHVSAEVGSLTLQTLIDG